MSTGGGSGGVSATVELDDSQIAAAVARLRAAMDQSGEAMKRLQADFAAGKVGVDQFEEELAQLTAQMGRAQTAASSFGASVASSGQRTQAAVRGITDFSRAAEDFSTGGFLGVMNNIPGVMTNVGAAFGVSATTMALFTAGASIAVATGYLLYRNWDSVTSLFQDKNPFPKTTDSIDGLTEAIKTNDKALDELRKKEGLNNEELAKANKLIAENIQLNKQLEEARKRKKDVESIVESVSPEQEEKAQAFKTASLGRGEEVRDGIIAHYERKKVDRNAAIISEMQAKAAEQTAAGDLRGAARTRKEAMGFVAANNAIDSGNIADELISDIMQGREGSFEKFKGIMNAPGNQDMFPTDLRNKFRSEDPETKRQSEKTSARAELDEKNRKRVEDAELEAYDKETETEQRGHETWRAKRKARQDKLKRSKQTEQKGLQEERQAVETAKEAVPGIDQLTEQAMLIARGTGASPERAKDQVKQSIEKELLAAGLTQEQASRASRSLTGDAFQKVQEQAVRTRLGMGDRSGQGGQGQREIRNSEVFSADDLANRVQSGVKNREEQHQNKMETLTEMMYRMLAERIPQEIAKARAPRMKVTR